MKYKFVGKNTTVTDSFKEKAELKLNKLKKFLPVDTEIIVTLKVVKNEQTVEVTIPLMKRIVRAEVKSKDAYVALDEVVDTLEKQIIKYKSQLRKRSRTDRKAKEEFINIFTEDDSLNQSLLSEASLNESYSSETSDIIIDKVKHFELNSMEPEEAAMEMELLGHNFFVFRNGSTGVVNVIYKRLDDSYGLIETK